jgi:hypothetical protein
METAVDPNINLWRTVFLAMTLAAMTLIIALSIFFYIRSREPLWDNRSGVSRLVVVNQSSPEKFGLETFSMFGGAEITLNGNEIADESTPYVGNNGMLMIEVSGLSRGSTTGAVSSYHSRFRVSRKGSSEVIPLDVTGSINSSTEIELAPINGGDGIILVNLNGSRVEFRGQWDTGVNLLRSYALRVDVLGWYP